MIDNFEKIRILWIDDCPDLHTGFMYPEQDLPEDLARYFTIIRHPEIPGPSSIRTSADWAQFRTFWGAVPESHSLFPPEIIAMDYNLSKWADTSDNGNIRDTSDHAHGSLAPKEKTIILDDTSNVNRNFSLYAGFEGLVLGIFSSAMLHRHPIGIVPMTNYGDLLAHIPEVRALHFVSKEILDIDFSSFSVSGVDRKWKIVLNKGTKALRNRIDGLYETHQIVLSPTDLMGMFELPGSQQVLKIQSPYASRSLPVQGLFLDVPADIRDDAISNWAQSLLKFVTVECYVLKKAQELADIIWAAYNNSALVNARERLSILAAEKESGNEYDKSEYNILCKEFYVVNKKCKSACVSIEMEGYSKDIQRWAAMLITLKLFKLVTQAQAKVNRNFKDYFNEELVPPSLTVRPHDLFLALFPVPSSPLILPWHCGMTFNSFSGWIKHLKTLGLNIQDILSGADNSRDGKKGGEGLTASERIVLQGFAQQDDTLDWSLARTFLYGKQ